MVLFNIHHYVRAGVYKIDWCGGDANIGGFGEYVEGAVSGAMFAGVSGFYGDTWSMGRVASDGIAGGASSKIYGGEFRDGFKSSMFTSWMQMEYETLVGYKANPLPGENRAKNNYIPIEGKIQPYDKDLNVFGLNVGK